MRVLIIGLPLFAKRLQKELSSFDSENTYIQLDTYYSAGDKLKALATIPTVDLVYSLNGTVKDSKVFSLALQLNKPLLIHWVGTDVLKAKAHIASDEFNSDFIDKATHLCEVSWIQKELEESGINAEVLNFVSFENSTQSLENTGDEFHVLTYITEKRAEFYGINTVIMLAKTFPETVFKIAGMDKYKVELPSNIELLGWVDNMSALFDKAGACLRFTEHDGLSSFVLEALAHSTQVIYNNDFDHCLYAPDEESVRQHIADLEKAHSSGEPLNNESGRLFIVDKFNRSYILGGLVGKFKNITEHN